MAGLRGVLRAGVTLAWMSLAVFFLTALSEAEPRRTAIALVSNGANRELYARLRAELAALGWRVRDVAPGPEVTLANLARRAHTLAVLRVSAGAEAIEVWAAPEVDAEARTEWIDVDASRPELAILRAVESLRARFLELGIEPEETRSGSPDGSAPAGSSAAPDSAPSPPEDVAAAAPENGPEGSPPAKAEGARNVASAATDTAPMWVALAAGPTLVSSVGDTNVALSGALRFAPTPWLLVGLEAASSLTATHVSAREGQVDLRGTWVGSIAELRAGSGPWTWGAGAGLAFAVVTMQGFSTTPDYRGNHVSLYTALPLGRMALELALAPRLRLRLEGSAGVTLPRVAVLVGSSVASYWGRPLLGATLGLEWAPFGASSTTRRASASVP